jgi:hypothetical protein
MAKSKGRRLAEWLRNLDSNSKASSDTIADDSISTAKLQTDAVTNPKIADGAIHTANLADANVTFAKLHTALVVTESDAISSNDNDTTVPTSAAVIDYVATQIATKDNSDEITEGSTNLYFTNERVDDRVNSLLTAGTGITLTYDDTANTLTVAGAAQYGDSDVSAHLNTSTASSGEYLSWNGSDFDWATIPAGYTDSDVASYLSTNGYGTSSSIIASITDSAPTTLDTLNELAAALGDDANFSTTTATSLGNRLRIDVNNQNLTGAQQTNALTNLGITATVAELNYVDGVTSNIQTQLNSKGTSSFSGAYADLTGKPTIPTNNNQLTNGAGYITDITTQTDSKYLRSDANDTGTNITLSSLILGDATLSHSTSHTWKTLTIQNAGDNNEASIHGLDSTGTQQFLVYGGSGSQGFLSSSYTWRFKVPVSGSLNRDNAHTLWDSGNDGSGSGLDADTLDGQQGSYYTSLANATGEFSTISATSASSRDKIRVYPSSNYAIGMQDNITYGHLSDWAMTFQMNDDTQSDRGFWWGDAGHSLSQGAMSLTTNGRATIATSLSIGQGESITGPNSTTLYVGGNAYINGATYGGISIGEANTNYDGWDRQLNIHGTGHARVNVKTANVRMGIYAHDSWHSGYAGHVGTYTNHPLSFICNAAQKAVLTTAGSLSTTSQGTLWGASNDGSGSGLDADTVDGIQGASFLRSDDSDTSTGLIEFQRGLGIHREDGVYVTPQSKTKSVYWKFAESSQLNSPPGSGTWRHVATIQGWTQHHSSYPSWQMCFGNGAFGVRQSSSNSAWNSWQTVWTSGNDGSGSGLDADTLDGSGWLDYGRDIHANQVIADDWLRTTGATGWYNNTYAGGWYMTDTTWIRSYNNKSIYQNTGTLRTDGTLQVGGNGATLNAPNGGTVTISGSTAWHAGNDGSGSGLDADLLDGQHASSFVSTSGATFTGLLVTRGNSAAFTGANDSTISVRSSSTSTAAAMSFHRPGAYAINLGLDTDNHFKLGGWSASTVKHTWQNNGTYLATGDIYAYYSDERLKTKQGKIENAIDKVNSIETFYYTHNDLAKEHGFEEEKMQIGVSAQTVEKVMPEVVALAPFDNNGSGVSISGENYKTVQYEKLVPLLIEAIKEQQAQIEELKEKLK